MTPQPTAAPSSPVDPNLTKVFEERRFLHADTGQTVIVRQFCSGDFQVWLIAVIGLRGPQGMVPVPVTIQFPVSEEQKLSVWGAVLCAFKDGADYLKSPAAQEQIEAHVRAAQEAALKESQRLVLPGG